MDIQKELSNRKLSLWFHTRSRPRTDSSTYVSCQPEKYRTGKVNKEEWRTGQRGTPAFGRQCEEGALKEEEETKAKEDHRERASWKASAQEWANTRERSRKIKTEKRPVAFVMKRSLLFYPCQWSFSEAVEEASGLQWFKEWIRGEETETVNTDNLFQEPGCKTRESTMVGGRVGVSMERVHAWWTIPSSLVTKRWWN